MCWPRRALAGAACCWYHNQTPTAAAAAAACWWLVASAGNKLRLFIAACRCVQVPDFHSLTGISLVGAVAPVVCASLLPSYLPAWAAVGMRAAACPQQPCNPTCLLAPAPQSRTQAAGMTGLLPPLHWSTHSQAGNRCSCHPCRCCYCVCLADRWRAGGERGSLHDPQAHRIWHCHECVPRRVAAVLALHASRRLSTCTQSAALFAHAVVVCAQLVVLPMSSAVMPQPASHIHAQPQAAANNSLPAAHALCCAGIGAMAFCYGGQTVQNEVSYSLRSPPSVSARGMGPGG